jgi:hypothetical protein
MLEDLGARIAPSSEFIAANLIDFCSSVLRRTLGERDRFESIADLGRLTHKLERFVRGYEWLEQPGISTDDETLNWAFTETSTDLTRAIWLLASGFYKASASSLRNALDVATASLYFQIRENEHTGPGYNPFFSEWDRGEHQLPHWGEIKTVIASQRSVKAFIRMAQLNPVEDAYNLFKHLCAYTHTSAFTKDGQPITAINFSGTAPAFNADAFERGCGLITRTMSQIAILWQVTFPGIAQTDPFGAERERYYAALFPLPTGPLVLQHLDAPEQV